MGLDPKGEFTYRDGVAVIQVFFFSAFLILGSVLCFRHGFKRSDGWIAIVTLSILRVLAGAFQLASINNPGTTTYGGALICQGIGLAPLTLLNMGLFVRLNKWVTIIPQRVFSVASIVVIIGLALGIYGGWSSADGDMSTNSELKASVIIFPAVYVLFIGMFALFAPRWNELPKPESGLLACFAVSIPFMLARYLYSIIGDFSQHLRPEFNQLTGNVTILLCMAVLEEIFVVAFFVISGLRLAKLPESMRDKPEGETELGARRY
ncbi:hypothetical protein N7456_001631 [Penicillium angulare]|uniref:DUF7702 domain-containing protein n=1 Tax=Penicillium angulare TaxID=116970 RepID=A0A9W9G6U4_9EURO|nr:hypothetical protein N7456_001631 [Penicillium angulare]